MTPKISTGLRGALTAALVLALAACGGSDPVTGTVDKAGSAIAGRGTRSPDATLTEKSLAQAEAEALKADTSVPLDDLPPGTIAAKQVYVSGDVARKAAALRIPVYRFYNTQTGAHFYTTSETEKANILATLPQFHLDGPAFHAASAFSPGLSPVYRFYNVQTGVHFYTISEAEKASILATLPQFHLDGPAYHASQVAGAGLVPLYRFYVPSRGFHFYTASEAEKNSIVANLSAVYAYEGPAYHVLAADWKAEKLPHTGVTSSQCFQAGGLIVNCALPSAIGLNPQQDGHRVAINPMGYSAVGVNPVTSCVRDNVTGLIWESKTVDGGPRDMNWTYSQLGNGLAGDASGHVAAMNAEGLCGYHDWRLPTRSELIGLVDYSANVAPRSKLANTANGYYWTSILLSGSTNPNSAWYVDFVYGDSSSYDRSSARAVRLVRGTVQSGPRYVYSTVAVGGDQANNTVSDSRTGLQWRRCEEGKVWNGSGCTGTTSYFTYEAALTRALSQTGWRLPNVKELESLNDLSLYPVNLDQTAFPNSGGLSCWSSTPDIWSSYASAGAYYVSFLGGIVGGGSGTNLATNKAVRLVRNVP